MAHKSSDDMPVFSRPTTSLLGKATEPVKCMVPPEVKDDLTTLWRSLGYGGESEFVRELLMVRLYGSQHITNLHAQRIRGVAHNLTKTGQE